MTDSRCRPASRTFFVVIALGVGFLLLLTACPLDFDDLEEPDVIDVTIDPSTISHSEIGSGNQEFSIDITVTNFEDEILDARAFIGDEERDAVPVPDEIEIIDENVVRLDGIADTWFNGYDPGIYDIGVEVESDTEAALAFEQATVEIVD